MSEQKDDFDFEVIDGVTLSTIPLGISGKNKTTEFDFNETNTEEEDNIDEKIEDEEDDKFDESDDDKDKKEDEQVETDESEEDEPESEEDAKEETETDEQQNPAALFANIFKESGIIDYDEIDEENFQFEDLEELVQKSVDSKIDEYKSSLPPVVKELTDYIEAGGNPNNFLQTALVEDYTKLDLENESNQKRIIKDYLKELGHSDEDIESDIEDLEDREKLGHYAEKYAAKLQRITEKNKEKEIQRQQQLASERERQIEEYNNSVKNEIVSSKEIAGLRVSPNDKKNFSNFILKRGKDGYTEYEKFILKDPVKNNVKLAYLAYKGFDFSDLLKEERTKNIEKLKKSISKNSNNSSTNTRAKRSQNETTDRFKAFKLL